MPGHIYKSEKQNISTFEDNIKFMADILFSIYFPFTLIGLSPSVELRPNICCENFQPHLRTPEWCKC